MTARALSGENIKTIAAFALVNAAIIAVVLSRPDLLGASLENVTPLMIAAGLAFFALTIRYSAIGVPVLVAFVYLNLSQALVRRYDVPSLLQLFVVTLAFAAWLKRDTEPLQNVLRQRLTHLLAIYLLLAFVSTAWATDIDLAGKRVSEIAKATAIYLLATLLIRNEKRLRQALGALVASAFVLGALVFIQTATQQFENPFFGLARIKQAHIYGDVFQPRIAGPLGDPNFFAQILLLALPPALLLGRKWWPAAAVILVTLMLTYSRGAMIALAVMGVMLVKALHVRWRTTIAAAALALIVFLALPASVTRRFITIEQILPTSDAPLRPDSSFQERKLLMTVAWVMFGANPVTGVGAGNYSSHYEEYADLTSSSARQYADPSDLHFPHNLYLEVAAEAGILGLVVFAAIIITAWRILRRDASPIAKALQISLIGFLISSLFLHLAFPRYLYLLFAFVATLERLSVTPRPRRSALRALPSAKAPIAILVSRFPLVTETFILREIIELERQGQSIVLVPMIHEHPNVIHEEAKPWIARAMYTPWLSPAIVLANLRAIGCKPRTYFSLLGWILARPRTMAKSLLLFPKSVYLAECLRDAQVGHLHAHFATHPATMARIISALSGIPYSFTVHAHDIFVERTLLREKIRDATFIRAISKFNKAFLENLYKEAEGKIEVIHVGVPITSAPRATGNGQRVTSVAALKPYKGLTHLIDALRSLDDIHCDIIGDGPLRGALQRQIDRYGLAKRVRLRGALPQHEVAAAIRECDVFVLPSIIAADRQMEGIPVALMEAMAAEKPVVATSISGIPELVEHDVNGLLVDPGNAPQLAAAIRALAANPVMRARFGARGREKVEREFSLQATVADLRSILDRHNRRPTSLRLLHHGADAVVYEIGDVIVKEHLSREGESRPPDVRAADEFRILQTIDGAPEPLSLDGTTVVMRRAKGTSLVSIIRAARKSGDTRMLIDAARATGAWLARFHEATNLIHGDFWPGNVFVHDGTVEAIDFEGARPGAPEYDVDYFLEHARRYYRFRGRAQWPLLRGAFLEGYGR